MNRHRIGTRNASAGIATVEFAIVLPLLLLLALPIVDFARAIQAHMILINISSEGASLASSEPVALKDASQAIMGSLAATAPALDMNARGMMYITKIVGNRDGSGAIRNVVVEQYRWDDRHGGSGWNSSRYSPASAIWNCSGWGNDGSCSDIPPPESAPSVDLMAGALSDGEAIYAVESFYHFDTFVGEMTSGLGKISAIGPDLYAMSVF
jgi:hypothetical protein